ncbi:GNAT family N-acetyltransferase [Candidatus Dojkabacteria bacterium]|nr:GNAT family N-acetyltransferase [Candidatus Dojkabacteria bacterium]
MIKIVTLTISDWQAYRDLRLQALKESPLAFTTTLHEALKNVADDWKGYLKSQNSITLFAKKGQSLVGMGAAIFNEKERTSHIAEIVGFYVLKEHRGKGIGGKLFQNILRNIEDLENIIKIKLGVAETQKAALGLYKKFGFKIIGTQEKELVLDGKYYDVILMEKMLNK